MKLKIIDEIIRLFSLIVFNIILVTIVKGLKESKESQREEPVELKL
jgi:hypothetical protein